MSGGAQSQSAPGLVGTQQATQDKLQVRQSQGCPACQAELLPGAIFCVECGHALGCPCPQCGAEVGGCDFCEACGHWLKPGQCRFCYAETLQGAAFCGECGNSQQGVRCTRCNTLGFFDFCSGCGDAVSDLAVGLVQAPADDPGMADALQQLRALDTAAQQASADLAQLQARAQPEASRARPAATPPPPQGLSLSGALQTMRGFAALDAAAAQRAQAQAAQDRHDAQDRDAKAQALAEEAERAQDLQVARQLELAQSNAAGLTLAAQQRALAEARRVARAHIEALIAAAAGQTYIDAQSARRGAMALRSRLVAAGQTPTQWLCNWANCRHDMPNDCGNPSLGGRWLFD